MGLHTCWSSWYLYLLFSYIIRLNSRFSHSYETEPLNHVGLYTYTRSLGSHRTSTSFPAQTGHHPTPISSSPISSTRPIRLQSLHHRFYTPEPSLRSGARFSRFLSSTLAHAFPHSHVSPPRVYRHVCCTNFRIPCPVILASYLRVFFSFYNMNIFRTCVFNVHGFDVGKHIYERVRHTASYR